MRHLPLLAEEARSSRVLGKVRELREPWPAQPIVHFSPYNPPNAAAQQVVDAPYRVDQSWLKEPVPLVHFSVRFGWPTLL